IASISDERSGPVRGGLRLYTFGTPPGTASVSPLGLCRHSIAGPARALQTADLLARCGPSGPFEPTPSPPNVESGQPGGIRPRWERIVSTEIDSPFSKDSQVIILPSRACPAPDRRELMQRAFVIRLSVVLTAALAAATIVRADAPDEFRLEPTDIQVA